jgi:hypothetical protein
MLMLMLAMPHAIMIISSLLMMMPPFRCFDSFFAMLSPLMPPLIAPLPLFRLR